MLERILQGHFFEHNKEHYDASVSMLSAFNSSKITWNNVKSFKYPFWVLDYTHGDYGFYRVKNTSWSKRIPETVHLYAPGTRYWEKRPLGSSPGFSSFITFYGGKFLDLQKYVDNDNGFGHFLDETGKLKRLLTDTALEASHRGEESYWFAMTKLYEIVDMLHSAQPLENETDQLIINQKDDDNPSHEQMFIESVRTYLQKHIGENVSIADLAGHLNASVSTVSHKYRFLTGETPMKTLSGFRINAIKNLLIRGEPIKSIAAQTGFCDEFYLSKVFKQATGFAPSHYLKRLKQS